MTRLEEHDALTDCSPINIYIRDSKLSTYFLKGVWQNKIHEQTCLLKGRRQRQGPGRYSSFMEPGLRRMSRFIVRDMKPCAGDSVELLNPTQQLAMRSTRVACRRCCASGCRAMSGSSPSCSSGGAPFQRKNALSHCEVTKMWTTRDPLACWHSTYAKGERR